ncbi:GDSL-type esterase/lipase family protein [Mailhella massiliensis]|uniref:GDSL-type esterase/lipase family protein n=1 Tax=Mailhella massiliensis TaxID=1903261 RepID=A0A921AXN2_9BACT|nr:GDSL-type esterase/lipase family protein [Mailhella massiliensis]HJD97974.1 GDSL-type esterase/lipase family protein [Mailhella massiliensis]
MKIFHFFGDSVTLGVNDAPAGGWVARLAGKAAAAGLQVPPDTFYNMGVRKNSSAMILERWKREFQARAMEGVPSFLIFCFGTVDMAAPQGSPNLPVGESAANAREILQKAKDYGSVVLISAPPVKDEAHCARLESLCTAYAAICAAVDVPFIDIFHPLLNAGYVQDLTDGVHPGPAGNEMIAEALIQSAPLKHWFSENEK